MQDSWKPRPLLRRRAPPSATKTVIAILALTALLIPASASADAKKKEKKDAPRKIEITGDKEKVREAIIKLEMDEGYILGEEQISQITFTEQKAKVVRSLLIGQAHFRDVFTFAS